MAKRWFEYLAHNIITNHVFIGLIMHSFDTTNIRIFGQYTRGKGYSMTLLPRHPGERHGGGKDTFSPATVYMLVADSTFSHLFLGSSTPME